MTPPAYISVQTEPCIFYTERIRTHDELAHTNILTYQQTCFTFPQQVGDPFRVSIRVRVRARARARVRVKGGVTSYDLTLHFL